MWIMTSTFALVRGDLESGGAPLVRVHSIA